MRKHLNLTHKVTQTTTTAITIPKTAIGHQILQPQQALNTFQQLQHNISILFQF